MVILPSVLNDNRVSERLQEQKNRTLAYPSVTCPYPVFFLQLCSLENISYDCNS